MPTENRRVATYLPKDVDERLEVFKTERGIKGDSQALIVILREFLGIDQPVSQVVAHSSRFATLENFEDLASQVSVLFEKVELLSRTLVSGLSELQQKPLGESLAEPVSEHIEVEESFRTDLPFSTVNQKDSEASSTATSGAIAISGTELAKRLNIGQSTISTRKKITREDFANWTRSKDPDGIAWAYMSDSGSYQPTGDVPTEVLSKLQSKPLIGLTTGDLATRIGVASSTLSHRKKEKTPEELTDWICKRDPEGIRWIFLPEFNRFRPEVDVLGSSQSVLQGSLLNTEPLTQVNP